MSENNQDPSATGEEEFGDEQASSLETLAAKTDDILVDENCNDATSCACDEVVPDPETEIASLNSQLEKERDRFVRAAADLDNMRKRCRRDVEDAVLRGRIQVLEEMLPALDSIDSAMRSIVPTPENQAIYDGMGMVKRQFMTAMEKFAMKAVDAEGLPFNPNVHEAVGHQPSNEVATGIVLSDLRSGYTLGERLVRASMVIVSAGPGPSKETQAMDAQAPQDEE